MPQYHSLFYIEDIMLAKVLVSLTKGIVIRAVSIRSPGRNARLAIREAVNPLCVLGLAVAAEGLIVARAVTGREQLDVAAAVAADEPVCVFLNRRRSEC